MYMGKHTYVYTLRFLGCSLQQQGKLKSEVTKGYQSSK